MLNESWDLLHIMNPYSLEVEDFADIPSMEYARYSKYL